jgi:hypothetical protein
MLHHIHIGDGLIADPAGVPDGGIGIDLAAAYNAAARPPGLIQITWTNQSGLYFNTPSNWSDDQTPENVDSGTITLAKAETIQLLLDTGANAVTNTGLIEATSGTGLVIESNIENLGGTISAANANIYLQDSTIAGGTLDSSGSGALSVA